MTFRLSNIYSYTYLHKKLKLDIFLWISTENALKEMPVKVDKVWFLNIIIVDIFHGNVDEENAKK